MLGIAEITYVELKHDAEMKVNTKKYHPKNKGSLVLTPELIGHINHEAINVAD